MKWLRQSLDGAGLSHRSLSSAIFTLLLIGVVVTAIAFEVTAILSFSMSVAVGAAGLTLEALNARARVRRANLEALWPEVLDSLVASISSGSSITEALLELAETGPAQLRFRFQSFKGDIDRGEDLDGSLERLKVRFGDVHADRLCELLRLVNQAGGVGLLDSLRNQVLLVRQELAFTGEIASKLGWITGTAKLAVGAPWLIVAMLFTRPENASAYASVEGSWILLIGLAVSIFAFRLVQMLGELPVNPRVFA